MPRAALVVFVTMNCVRIKHAYDLALLLILRKIWNSSPFSEYLQCVKYSPATVHDTISLVNLKTRAARGGD